MQSGQPAAMEGAARRRSRQGGLPNLYWDLARASQAEPSSDEDDEEDAPAPDAPALQAPPPAQPTKGTFAWTPPAAASCNYFSSLRVVGVHGLPSRMLSVLVSLQTRRLQSGAAAAARLPTHPSSRRRRCSTRCLASTM